VFESAVSGLITGSAGALIGLCLVLTYRTAGVINFAQGAFGTFGAFTALQMHDAGWAYVPSALVGLLSGAALSIALGVVMLRFFPEASVDAKTGVTIGILVTMLTGGLLIFGNDPHQFPAVLPGVSVTVGGVVVPGPTIAGIVLSVVLAAAFTLYLGRTRTGTRIRAVASRPVTSEVLGIPVRGLTVAIWGAGGAITAAAMLIIAPSQGGQYFQMSLLVLSGLAAALCGLFRSLPLTVAGGLVIGVLGGMLTESKSLTPYADSVAFVLILAILLVTQRKEAWDAAR
jgi:branched-chain amino acid transport system permease protein